MQHLAEFFEQGGFFMYVNLVCSVITIAFIVERTIFFLGKGSVNAKAFLEQIRKLVAANNVDRAIKLCSATEAPVARVARHHAFRRRKSVGQSTRRSRRDPGSHGRWFRPLTPTTLPSRGRRHRATPFRHRLD